MKNRMLILACLLPLTTGPSLQADRIRLNLTGWSGNTESEMRERSAIELNNYDAITTDTPLRSVFAALGQKMAGYPPINYMQSSRPSRDNTPGPAGIEYWLTFGKNALIFGGNAYAFSPTYRYTLVGDYSPALNGSTMLRTTTIGAGTMGLNTIRAEEASLGLRLALGDNLFVTPHVSGLSLHREMSSFAYSQESTTMMGMTFEPSLYLDNRSLSGNARGNLVGLGLEIALAESFSIIGDFASSPNSLRGQFSETKVQTVFATPSSDPSFLITMGNDRMKVGVRRGMFGIQFNFFNSLHLRVGYLQEDHTVSYSDIPFQILLSSSGAQTTTDFLDLYPYDYRLVMLREMTVHQAIKPDRKGGAFFGVSYDINLGKE